MIMCIARATLRALAGLRGISIREICAMSINAELDKKIVERFAALPLPKNTAFADYIWIDGSGTYLRSKTRTLNFAPACVEEIPKWKMDGSKTQQFTGENSDLHLMPVAMYHDPFRLDDSKLVLCETYHMDLKPTSMNHRTAYCETYAGVRRAEPRFAFEQDFMLMHVDGIPLGWPCGGGEMPPTGKYYCAVGAASSMGRDIVEAHARACLFAGVAYEGFNQEHVPSKWKFRIAPSKGVKAPDDVVVARYLLCRVAEQFGVEASFHPKLFPHITGSGLHVNFSTRQMQGSDGIDEISRAATKLCRNHKQHMKVYDPRRGKYNKYRLGKDYDKFTWGAGHRDVSVRIPCEVCRKGCGYLEDRRPASNSDPYAVCEIIMRTVLCH